MTIICEKSERPTQVSSSVKFTQKPFDLGTREGRKRLYEFVFAQTQKFKKESNGETLTYLKFKGVNDQNQTVSVQCSYQASNLVSVEITSPNGKRGGYINPQGDIVDKNGNKVEDWIIIEPRAESLER